MLWKAAFITVVAVYSSAMGQFHPWNCINAPNQLLNHPCGELHVQIPFVNGEWIAPTRAGFCCDNGRGEACFYRWLPLQVNTFYGPLQEALYYARPHPGSAPIVQVVAVNVNSHVTTFDCQNTLFDPATLVGLHTDPNQPCELKFDPGVAQGVLYLSSSIDGNVLTNSSCFLGFSVIDLTKKCPCEAANFSIPPMLPSPPNKVELKDPAKSYLVVAYYESCHPNSLPEDDNWNPRKIDLCKAFPIICRSLKLHSDSLIGNRIRLTGEPLIIPNPCDLFGKNGCPSCSEDYSKLCLLQINIEKLKGYIALLTDLNTLTGIAQSEANSNGDAVISVPVSVLNQFGGLNNLALAIVPLDSKAKKLETKISVSIK